MEFRKKYLALIGIIVLFFSSCMVNRKGELTTKGINFIAQHCKGSDSSSTSDHTTILFDTVQIEHYTQGPIQYLQSPCDSSGNLKPINITKKFNGITGSVKTVGNILVFDCSEDSLKMIIQTQKRVINSFEKSKVVIQEPCKKEHLTKWEGFTYWWFWITAGLILLIIIGKALKAYFKIQVPFL